MAAVKVEEGREDRREEDESLDITDLLLDDCWKPAKRRLAVRSASGSGERLLVRAKNLHSSRFVIMDEFVLGSKEVLLPSAVLLDRDCSANFINFGIM